MLRRLTRELRRARTGNEEFIGEKVGSSAEEDSSLPKS